MNWTRNITELSHNDFIVENIKTPKTCLSGILFYSMGCSHCIDAKPIWERVAKDVGFAKLYAYNVEDEQNREHLLQVRERSPNLINSYPTIAYYVDGKYVEKFSQTKDRTVVEIINDLMRLRSKCKKH